MYIWLLFFDSEWLFRLPGVIITFVGSLGIYFGIKHISSWKWGIAGMIVFLMSSSVIYYALECAEYNLLLCMESWALYFFIRCLFSYQLKQSNCRNIIGFILFSCLSIYSQYGAVFFVFPLFLIMLGTFIRKREFNSLKQLIICSLIALIIAGLPLWYFFIRIQMERQNSLSVSHHPVFVKNLFYSYFMGLAFNMKWITNGIFVTGKIIMIFHLLILFITGIMIFVGVIKKKNPISYSLLGAFFISWTLFFIMASCSYYGYNNWNGQLGFNNVIGGSRYVLFIVPLTITTCLYGLYVFFNYYTTRKVTIIFALMALLYVTSGVYTLFKGINKSSIREAVEVWYNNKCYTKKTVVQESDIVTFQFYFRHLPIYNHDNISQIIETNSRMRTHSNKEMFSYLKRIGVLDLNEFFYIGSYLAPLATNNLDMIKETIKDAGFSVNYLWKGESVLFHCKKINNSLVNEI